ncbi:hypothetical protein swp_3338 [Shewanella piezotolerans WP3]|uniref:Uncharacterized protein n=1 Tax=Shewanella piezotolerans (strain WP3 / JCM 13877) TaxID=225849 RepID=B8CRN2_SHEPW|nr:hypothetical protein swp_3338 [Shewanella piezotolerans WP3]
MPASIEVVNIEVVCITLFSVELTVIEYAAKK